jgi:outer membrane protein assembly factor BamA
MKALDMSKKFFILLLISFIIQAPQALSKEEESPWLVTPLLSIDPKLGASVGVLGGYIYKIDPKSESSITALSLNYSNSNSLTGGLFSRNYIDENQHKVLAGIFFGEINNSYDNFLGSGLPGETKDIVLGTGIRYMTKVYDQWYIGPQVFGIQYDIQADDAQTINIINNANLEGITQIALGGVVEFDSRNNPNSPTEGMQVAFNYNKFSTALGSDDNAEVFYTNIKFFTTSESQHTFAMRLKGRKAADNPPEAMNSSVDLRGYVRGENLEPIFVSLEVEERFFLHQKWRMTLFTGLGCLTDDISNCGESEKLYPMAGLGVLYVLKVEDQLVLRFDLAAGKDERYGIYLKFGQSF